MYIYIYMYVATCDLGYFKIIFKLVDATLAIFQIINL